MKRIPFTVVLILMFFAAYSSAIKNACPPEADCEDENQIMQPSEIEVEEKLGVKDCVAMAARAYARQKKISIAKNQKKANTVKIRRNALSSQEE